MRELFRRAGIEDHGAQEHPEHGVMLSASGTRKVCALALDQGKAQVVRDQVAAAVRRGLRAVPKEQGI